jgi:uncharacterized membrane protein
MTGGNVTKKIIMTKLRNAFANSIVVFLMIGSVSAVLAVFLHSIMFMPAWISFASGLFALFFITFITMVGVEYSMEQNDD